MADSPLEKSTVRSTNSSVQLSFSIAPLRLKETEEEWEIVAGESSIEVQQRLAVIQKIITAQGTDCYGKVHQGTLCLRRKPSDGGIVERPFGTFNREFFSTLPGYVSSNVATRSPKAETEACFTLLRLERLLVRYIVDHYNQRIDARMGDQSRIGRWEAGRMAQLPLL
jgi:hypothetical protein